MDSAVALVTRISIYDMVKKIKRGSIIAGVLIGSTISLMFLVFSIFENAVGHGIAIASLAATTTIVVFQSQSRAGKPVTIAISYISAAAVGVMVSFLPEHLEILQIGLGLLVLIVLLFSLDRMHPPAVAYLFGFILGDYGLMEFFLTLMALMAFFVSLAVMVFLLEEVSALFGMIKRPNRKRSMGFRESIESVIDRVVPFSLVVLFASVLSQFLYPEALAPYDLYLSLVDWFIILLLVVDLMFKFRKAISVKGFLRKYWLEIVAVLPFVVIIRAFQGVAISVEFLTRGALMIPVGSQAFLRFLRPMARFPRFVRMLDNLDSLAGITKK